MGVCLMIARCCSFAKELVVGLSVWFAAVFEWSSSALVLDDLDATFTWLSNNELFALIFSKVSLWLGGKNPNLPEVFLRVESFRQQAPKSWIFDIEEQHKRRRGQLSTIQAAEKSHKNIRLERCFEEKIGQPGTIAWNKVYSTMGLFGLIQGSHPMNRNLDSSINTRKETKNFWESTMETWKNFRVTTNHMSSYVHLQKRLGQITQQTAHLLLSHEKRAKPHALWPVTVCPKTRITLGWKRGLWSKLLMAYDERGRKQEFPPPPPPPPPTTTTTTSHSMQGRNSRT